MIVLKNVLVATDFSEPSAVALTYGRDLARSYGARLHVLHVTESILIRFSIEAPIAYLPPSSRSRSRQRRGAASTRSSAMRTKRRSTPRAS